MSNIIDISARITNELPIVKISDELIVTVNNRHSTIMSMQLLIKEQTKSAQENNDEYDEMGFMEKVLTMLTSKKVVDAINKLDLPIPEYKFIYSAIMAAATGQSQEEVDKRFQG